MSKNSSLLIVVSILILLQTACARTKVRLPALLQQAERHNAAGVAAESKQEFIAAESDFKEAYLLYSSVENYTGMVTALINSSRLHRRLGDTVKTGYLLSQAVSLIPQTPELEAEICFEMSKLSAMKGGKEEALLWAERALNRSRDADRSRMLNLVAVMHLGKGAVQKGREMAEAAIKHGRSVSDRPEEANASRLLGEIALLEKRYPDALQFFEAALAIDKELAIPGRVAADLTALSLAAEGKGDVAKGADYLQRAVDAGISDKNSKAAAGKLERLIKLYEQSGNSQAAEKTRNLEKNLQGVKAE